jgi:hypothetical protein
MIASYESCCADFATLVAILVLSADVPNLSSINMAAVLERAMVVHVRDLKPNWLGMFLNTYRAAPEALAELWTGGLIQLPNTDPDTPGSSNSSSSGEAGRWLNAPPGCSSKYLMEGLGWTTIDSSAAAQLPLQDMAATCAAASGQATAASSSSFLAVLETVQGQAYGRLEVAHHLLTTCYVEAVLDKAAALGGKAAFTLNCNKHYM